MLDAGNLALCEEGEVQRQRFFCAVHVMLLWERQDQKGAHASSEASAGGSMLELGQVVRVHRQREELA